jgi:hypothetical protein
MPLDTISASTFSASAPTPPTPPRPAPQPYLKKVEGTGYFQKVRLTQEQDELREENLRFTYCDLTDYATRPFGNLFPALRLPVSAVERAELGAIFQNTALSGLEDLEQIVVAELPSNTYGELVDGKSIELHIPVVLNGEVTDFTLYGGYYGFNTDLNNQYSDVNPLSGYLGCEPTPENDFNSNIAYLFCNQIQRPKDTVTTTSLLSGQLTVPARGEAVQLLELTAGMLYRLPALTSGTVRVKVLVTGGNLLNLADTVDGVITDEGSFRLRQNVSELHFYNDTYAPISVNTTIERIDIGSTRSWSGWTPLNRYPTSSNGVGKVVGQLIDASGRGVVDEPVGLVYLDKGLLVLTHPLLVDNLSREGALLAAGGPAPTTGPYTELYYPMPESLHPLATLSYRSTVSELRQTFTCVAGIGEFTQSTNPSYPLAYPDASTSQPLYISEVGLYNRFGELMALAKLSKPVRKEPNRPVNFTLSLRA